MYHKMQSMNQSLAALVINGAIARERALASSSNPGDLDLILRKLLYSSDPTQVSEDGQMPESVNDFSKILELQEIKKLYEESSERHSMELSERDAEIARLSDELNQLATQAGHGDNQASELQAENDRLLKQFKLMRQEADAKIERLSARIRELSGTSQSVPPDSERRGFFRR